VKGMGPGRLLTAAALGLASVLVSSSALAADDDPFPIPLFRVNMGPAIHLAPERVVTFALDVTTGLDVTVGELDSTFALFGGELGYTYDAYGLHHFNAGPTVGVGNVIAAVSYRPKLMAGSDEAGVSAIGMRNAIAGHFIADIFMLELGHQFSSYAGELHHDVRVLIGVNVAAPPYYLALAIAGLNRIFR
jgi:hypothetical protein